MKSKPPMPQQPSRRRFLAIAAVAGGALAMPYFARANRFETVVWHGSALGARASLTLQHPDGEAARSVIADCLDEVTRLETIFSLFAAESALSRLNATGRLDNAPLDMRIVVAEALRLAERSGGAFDPTVQPLWEVYARHFASPEADVRGPGEDLIAAVRERIGWQKIKIDDASIAFEKAGMALTLNGIAQGYITDRVANLLQSRGFEHVLVNLGEQRALGAKFDGQGWTIGISDPVVPDRPLDQVTIASGAVATSSPTGTTFDAAGDFGHILDPRTGRPAKILASVTVLAETAMVADGLSTALAVADTRTRAHLLEFPNRAFIVPLGGDKATWIG